ncbi:MAG: AMP-binding protein [Chloroflexota bacterium]
MTNTLQSLILSLESHGELPALRLRTEYRGFTWSYRELARRIRAGSYWLRAQGLARGDRFVLWAPNSPTWVGVYLAGLALGLVAVPIDLHATPEFVERVLEETSARLLLRGRFQVPARFAGRSALVERLDWDIRPGEPEDATWPDLVPDDLAEIMYTSGTTSVPRGVMLTHGNLSANLIGVQPVVPREPFYRFVSLLPLSHTFEQIIGLLLPLSRGGEVIYLEALKPSTLLGALRDERPNALILVPRLLELLRARVEGRLPALARQMLAILTPILLATPLRFRRALFTPIRRALGGDLRYLVVGGAPLDRELERFWDSLGFLVLQGYGLTEAGPVVTANTPTAHRVGSVGRPLPNVRIRFGHDGEILAQGPSITPGYFRKPEATAAARSDGWLRTGDLGQIDRAGFLLLRGRQRDLIVTPGGLNVFPEDVEIALNRQTGVRDSVVVERNGQVFAVLLLDPRQAPDPARIVDRANAQLNSIQRIQGWTIWPGADFPRTPTQKVRKFQVREALASNLPERPAPARPVGRIERIVQDVAPERTVTPTAQLGPDLGLSSIDRLELITLLEEEFHVDLPETEVNDDTSVADLDRMVRHGMPRRRTRPATWPLRPLARKIRAAAQRALIFPVLHQILWTRAEGCDHLAGLTGPVIFAGNHLSHLDGPAVLLVLPDRFRSCLAIGALAGFYFPPSNHPIERWWHEMLFWLAQAAFNLFPIPRARGFRESLRHTGYLVDRGWNILIFPEGTRSLSGQPTPFREGIGLLASELKVPIVPFRVRGTYRVLPRGAWIPRPGPVTIRFGPPLTLPPLSYWEATRLIEEAVAKL